MTDIDAWLAESPFLRDLGVRWRDGEIVMTVTEPHTRTGALHGGATAALAALSAQATMRASDPDLDPSTSSLHVTYPRSGRGTVFTAVSTPVRRARELGFYQTEVRDAEARVIATASSALSADRHGGAHIAVPPPLPHDPGELARGIESIPFMRRRGVRTEGVDHGALELTMAAEPRNLDGKGRLHEGAVLTLIDVAGACVPWTHSRPSDATSGVTITLHAHMFGELPDSGVVARAGVTAHDDRFFWCDVDVFTQADGRLCAKGHLTYRYL